MMLSSSDFAFTNILILIMLYVGGVRAELGTTQVCALVCLIEYAIMALNNINNLLLSSRFSTLKGNRSNPGSLAKKKYCKKKRILI